jgi:hypothetical protein
MQHYFQLPKAIVARYSLIFLTLLVLFLSIVVVWKIIQSVNVRASPSLYGTGDITYEESSAGFQTDKFGLVLDLNHIGKTSVDAEREYVQVILDEINFPVSSYQPATFNPNLCVDQVVFRSMDTRSSSLDSKTWNFQNVCAFLLHGDEFYNPGGPPYLRDESGKGPAIAYMDSETIRPLSWFPFDKLEIGFIVNMGIQDGQNASKQHYTMAPPVKVILHTIEWQPQTEFSIRKFHDETYTLAQVALVRPFAYQVITVIVFLIIFSLILLIMFLNKTGDIIQSTAVLVFSLWGTKGILIPNYISSFTLIDGLIWISLVLIAFVLFCQLFTKPMLSKLKSEPSAIEPTTISNMSLRKLEKHIDEVNDLNVLLKLRDEETNNKNRKGAMKFINRRIRKMGG